MKEHVLSDSDRAALQSLIPLAGALGAGTIFALFFGGRKRGSGTAVFELFAIVAVLVSVGMTAYLAIALLHADEPLGDKELTQTAMPLISAAFLLILVSAISRFPGSVERLATILPLGLLAGIAALWLASSTWSFAPEDVPLLALLILAAGGLAALLAWGADRVDRRWERGIEHRRFVRLSVAGYRVTEKELRLALPNVGAGEDGFRVSCWTRKERTYLDLFACQQVRDVASTRWDRLAEEKGGPPIGAATLVRVAASHWALVLFRPHTARFWVFEPGIDEEVRVHELEANDDRLFDVTELGIV